MASFPVDPIALDELLVTRVWNQTVKFLDEFGIAMIASPNGYENPDRKHYVFDFGKGLKVRVYYKFDADDNGYTRTNILSVEFFR